MMVLIEIPESTVSNKSKAIHVNIKDIVNLHLDIFSEAEPPSVEFMMSEQAGTIFVLISESVPIGLAIITTLSNKISYLTSFGISTSNQGEGVGSKWFNTIRQILFDSTSVTHMLFDSDINKSKVTRFYRKNGCRVIDVNNDTIVWCCDIKQ